MLFSSKGVVTIEEGLIALNCTFTFQKHTFPYFYVTFAGISLDINYGYYRLNLTT